MAQAGHHGAAVPHVLRLFLLFDPKWRVARGKGYVTRGKGCVACGAWQVSSVKWHGRVRVHAFNMAVRCGAVRAATGVACELVGVFVFVGVCVRPCAVYKIVMLFPFIVCFFVCLFVCVRARV